MSFLLILVVYITIICSFIFIMLFGPNEMFRGTIIEKIHWFVTAGALQYLLDFYEKIFGKPFNTKSKAVKIFTSFKNRFIQLFYLSISLGGIILFFYTALYRLPNQFLGPIHFYIMPVVIAFIYVSFYVASVSNPGYVTKENVDKLCKHFKYDHILFSERTCETCKLQKPARSKHCNTCGHCVAKSDHHCSWINNCVGYLNFRWFLLFLFSNIVISVYGCYLSYYIIKAKGIALGLDRGYAFNRITRQYDKIDTQKYLLVNIIIKK
ncbi:zf-DHHC-domain-containing protein [Anaeromyces robustus]|uniref:Palmitoyltransferase n=1 Tax=Anaeromyces robustus TaxID=1754192 RepID=A0A1Y1WJX7_9FUNG|nr:zf-DHHC-domain-containing protein [Anaeromyces robustus]|eukprot:ORX73516.1 zf-DHHC-domain-containing protein [Anaeromyces robustus]